MHFHASHPLAGSTVAWLARLLYSAESLLMLVSPYKLGVAQLRISVADPALHSLQSEPPRYLSHKLLRGLTTRSNLISVHKHGHLTRFTARNDGWIPPIYTLTHVIWLIIAMERHKINA